MLINDGAEAHTIRAGDRIAQLVLAPVTRVAIEEASDRDGKIRLSRKEALNAPPDEVNSFVM